MRLLNDVSGGSCVSGCGKYRFTLGRYWNDDLPEMLFIMLNPSTADADRDDRTIRRCIEFARRENCGAVSVVNLFAFRATDPAELEHQKDAIGPDNDRHIIDRIDRCKGPIVAAWGSFPHLYDRDKFILRLLRGVPVYCLGTTKSGAPRHPLYVKSTTPLIPFGATV